MTNTKTKFTDLLIPRMLIGIALVAIVLALPRIAATAEAMTLAQCPAGTHQITGECVPDVLVAAEDTDTTAEDVAAEGADVLPISFHAAPADLWNALREVMPAAYDDDVTSIGTFWVPVGSTIYVEDGLYLATLDGWGHCRHGITVDGPCSRDDGTVAVEMLDIELVPAAVIYGADDLAQCSTDAQCAALDEDRALAGLDELDGPAYGTEQNAGTDAGQVLNVAHTTTWGPIAEDGTRVPHSFYDRVAGPTQATCDHLGKQRVADPVYGHRCV